MFSLLSLVTGMHPPCMHWTVVGVVYRYCTLYFEQACEFYSLPFCMGLFW